MALVDIVKQDVVDFATELAGTAVSDTAWVRILAHVNGIDLTGLGESEETTQLARIYLAAHMGKVSKGLTSNAAGPVVSESVGGVRRTYANTIALATSAASLSTTGAGRAYLDIINSSMACGPHLAGI